MPNILEPDATPAPMGMRRQRERPSSRRRVGVLDLLADATPKGLDRVYAAHFRRQFTSLTPQAVSVWARQLGHEVFYATYYGQALPHELLPGDLDVVFIGTYTKASALAYALGRIFGATGALTVIGGPHATSFPHDCLRFFDIVVDRCDKTLIDDIVSGRIDRQSLVSSPRPLTEFPAVQERMPELEASSLGGRHRTMFKVVPLLASVGCPYTCDFCVDWKNPYARLPSDRLAADLGYVGAQHPKAFVAYHDPNFGVQFDQTMNVIESVPKNLRRPYVIESALSVLKLPRLRRLKETRCAYLAPGIESWTQYSNKTGTGSMRGHDKLNAIVEQFHVLQEYVEGFQANFVFGNDSDKGTEPLELTKEFVRRLPFVWPGVNIPTPFGGTPLYDALWSAGRVLPRMPFAFYYNPYLVFIPKHYEPAEYYDNLLDLFSLITSSRSWYRRLTNGRHWLIKFIHSVQALGMRHEMAELRRIRDLMRSSRAFRAFHEGGDEPLPDFYHERFETRLGPYAPLLSRADRAPLHIATPVATAI